MEREIDSTTKGAISGSRHVMQSGKFRIRIRWIRNILASWILIRINVK